MERLYGVQPPTVSTNEVESWREVVGIVWRRAEIYSKQR